jgi:type III secretion system YscJ/HrcJ family lipoprotein
VQTSRFLCLVVFTSFLISCGSEAIVHDLDEREANRILELLADKDIQGFKLMEEKGRSITYTIHVPSANRMKGIRILNQNDLPRRKDKGYHEVFSESGLIPTSTEERAKKMAAIEGEIERQLKLFDGILDVEVQLVIPEESALRMSQDLRTKTTASVTIRYLEGEDNAKPLMESQVQAIVAAGVEKLSPADVVVLMKPANSFRAGSVTQAVALTGIRGWSQKQVNWLLAGVIAFVLFLLLGLLFLQTRLKMIREKLIRLQTEIAKARKKPGEEVAI